MDRFGSQLAPPRPRSRYESGKPPKNASNTRILPPDNDSREVFYDYADLASPSKWFRLLRLMRTSTPDRLECTLSAFEIDKERYRYTALSYNWGVGQLKPIFIDDAQVFVAKSLYDFLSSCQRRNDRSRFWIDAICINQNNITERNAQVEVMSSIYMNAAKVDIWLGLSNKDTDLLFATLNKGNSKAEIIPEIQLSQTTLVSKKKRKSLKTAWLSVLNRPYWGRMWIYQEVVLARNITVICGEKTVEWDLLGIMDDEIFRDENPRAFSGLLHYQDLRRARQMQMVEFQTLESLIFRCATRKCLLKHDRVYALLGVSKDYRIGRSELKPDYALSLEALYFQVMQFCDPTNPIEFGSRLAELLDLAGEMTDNGMFVSREFRLTSRGKLGPELTEYETNLLPPDARHPRGIPVHRVSSDDFMDPQPIFAMLRNDDALREGIHLYPLTSQPGRQNIALGFAWSSESKKHTAIAFGMWTVGSHGDPQYQDFARRIDFVKSFIDAATVEVEQDEEGGSSLIMTANFKWWSALFTTLQSGRAPRIDMSWKAERRKVHYRQINNNALSDEMSDLDG